MKYYFYIVLLLPSVLWALPCPNGNGILYKGDSIDEVRQECGPPLSERTNTRIIYTYQDWTYYIPHASGPGFSELVISFKNDQINRIHINERFWFPNCSNTMVQIGGAVSIQTTCNNSYDANFTLLCGISFGIGDTIQRVNQLCGPPAAQTQLDSYTVTVNELVYQGQTIIFENGKLTEWNPR